MAADEEGRGSGSAPESASSSSVTVTKPEDVSDPINGAEFQKLVETPALRSTSLPINQDIVLPDTEPRILKALLWFVYTATLLEKEQDQEQESFMGKMLAATDELGMERLKAIYESRILERVSDESVASRQN